MTASGPVAYLSNIGVRLGDPRPLTELDDVGVAGLADRFGAEGLVHARVASGPTLDLTVASVADSLEDAPRPDVYVYASNTCLADATDASVHTGLSTVPLIGLTRNGCANVVSTLRVARSLLAEEETESVAVTMVDASAGQRLIPGEIGVLSDGAASCLISRQRPERGWAITGLASANEFRLQYDDGSDPKRSAEAAHVMAREIRSAVARLTAARGIAPAAYDVVLMNHYTWSTLAMFAKLIDLPIERLYDATRSSVSHCFGADPLVDLASMESENLPAGARVFALASGPGVWGMFSLTRL